MLDNSRWFLTLEFAKCSYLSNFQGPLAHFQRWAFSNVSLIANPQLSGLTKLSRIVGLCSQQISFSRPNLQLQLICKFCVLRKNWPINGPSKQAECSETSLTGEPGSIVRVNASPGRKALPPQAGSKRLILWTCVTVYWSEIAGPLKGAPVSPTAVIVYLENIGFVYPAMSMMVIVPSLLY